MDTTINTKAHQPAAFGTPVAMFVAAVIAAGLVVAGIGAFSFDTDNLGLLAVLAGFVILAEVFDVRLLNSSRVSVSAVLIFAAAIVAGISGAVLLSLLTACVDFAAHRKDIRKGLFNAGALVVSGGAFVGTMRVFGADNGDWPELLMPALAAAYVNFTVNSVLVCTVISLDTGARPIKLWMDNFLPLVPFYAVFGVLAATMASAHYSEGTAATAAVFAPIVTMRFILHKAIGERRTEERRDAPSGDFSGRSTAG